MMFYFSKVLFKKISVLQITQKYTKHQYLEVILKVTTVLTIITLSESFVIVLFNKKFNSLILNSLYLKVIAFLSFTNACGLIFQSDCSSKYYWSYYFYFVYI